jgi:hypothetical protein
MSAVPSSLDTGVAPSPALHYGLWVVQALLAVAFLGAGIMKATTPLADLGAAMPWVADAPVWLPRFIGVSEILGAVGLVLPSALRIVPVLTAVAAGALAIVMGLAVVMHLSYGELGTLPVNLGLAGLAAFVAWGRSSRAAIRAR